MARGLKLRVKKVEGLYYLCSENRGADQLRGDIEADLRLCVRICKKPVFSRRGGSAVAWWLTTQTPDPEVGGSRPTRVKPCCVLEQGKAHLLPKSTGNTQEVVAPSHHD